MRIQSSLLVATAIISILTSVGHSAPPAPKADVEKYLLLSGTEDSLKQNVGSLFTELKRRHADNSKILALLTPTSQEQVTKDQREFLMTLISRHLDSADIKYLNDMYQSKIGTKLKNISREASAAAGSSKAPISQFVYNIESTAAKPNPPASK